MYNLRARNFFLIFLIYHPLKVCKMDGRFFFLFMERRGVNFIYLLSDATNIKYVRILYQGRKYILLMWYHVTLDAKWYFTFIPRY